MHWLGRVNNIQKQIIIIQRTMNIKHTIIIEIPFS